MYDWVAEEWEADSREVCNYILAARACAVFSRKQ